MNVRLITIVPQRHYLSSQTPSAHYLNHSRTWPGFLRDKWLTLTVNVLPTGTLPHTKPPAAMDDTVGPPWVNSEADQHLVKGQGVNFRRSYVKTENFAYLYESDLWSIHTFVNALFPSWNTNECHAVFITNLNEMTDMKFQLRHFTNFIFYVLSSLTEGQPSCLNPTRWLIPTS